MPRTARRPDPDAGPVERFAHELHLLREAAGTPDYRSMARRAHVAPSTLSTAAAGKQFPTLEATLAFVRACGGDEAEWGRRWRAAQTAWITSGATRHTPPPPRTDPGHPGPGRRNHLLAALAAVIVVAGIAAATITLLTPGPGGRPAGAHGLLTAPAPQPPGPAPHTSAPVAGPGCGTTPARLFSTYTPPGSQNWTPSSGGWPGCAGAAEYTHLTGLATTWADTAEWTFQLTSGHRCSFQVYIPRTPRADGHAQYDIYPRPDAGYSNRMATFAIDQASARGHWVTAGPYQFPGPLADIVLTDRGNNHATIALSAIGLICH